jgi:hypothetical protein
VPGLDQYQRFFLNKGEMLTEVRTACPCACRVMTVFINKLTGYDWLYALILNMVPYIGTITGEAQASENARANLQTTN